MLKPLRLSAKSLFCSHTCGQRASLNQLLMHSSWKSAPGAKPLTVPEHVCGQEHVHRGPSRTRSTVELEPAQLLTGRYHVGSGGCISIVDAFKNRTLPGWQRWMHLDCAIGNGRYCGLGMDAPRNGGRCYGLGMDALVVGCHGQKVWRCFRAPDEPCPK